MTTALQFYLWSLPFAFLFFALNREFRQNGADLFGSDRDGLIFFFGGAILWPIVALMTLAEALVDWHEGPPPPGAM